MRLGAVSELAEAKELSQLRRNRRRRRPDRALPLDRSQCFLRNRLASFSSRKSETYDFITLHHVIEHMPPTIGIELLKAICHSLRPGGTAIIQTPNMSSISAGFSRFIEVTHVTGYTDSSLHEALLLAGFTHVVVFGSRTPFKLTPKRVAWMGLQSCFRLLWRAALFSELGSDAPRVLTKNLYAVAHRSTT